MNNRDTNEIKEAYMALAKAAGVELDEEDTGTYLKRLISTTMKLTFQDADSNLQGLTTRVNNLVKNIEQGKQELAKNELWIRGIANNVQREFSKTCKEIAEDKLNALSQFEPTEQANPFHNAIEDFLKQLEAHSFPDDGKGEALSAFINSMGYLYWQNNAKKKSCDDDVEYDGLINMKDGLINRKGRKPFGKRL